MDYAKKCRSSGSGRQGKQCEGARGLRLRPIASAVLLCLASSQISAQSTPAARPEATAEVVITGTLIRGAAPAGSTAIRLDRESIEQSGVTTTAEILRQVPQIVNLGADEGHTNATQNANANITFGTGVNLRGLGTESTLTLVNGRRVAPNGTMGQFVDTSMIPAMAISGLEVVPDGASATYGSDAVGGVVNIHLREHYNGAQTELKFGTGKDISSKDFSQLWGKVWDSGDVTLTYEHYERSNLKAADRAYYSDDLRPFGGPDLRVFSANPGTVLIGTTKYAIPANQNGTGLTAARFTAGTQNLQSIYAGGYDALPEQKRDSFVATFNQKLTDRISLFGNGYFSERDFVRFTTAQSSALAVPRTNPYFVCPGTCGNTVTVNYSFLNDLGPTRQAGYESIFNGTIGAKIDLGSEWKGVAYTTYGADRDFRRSTNVLNNAQLSAALADTNAATALNAFGAGSFTNPATLDKIRAVGIIAGQYTLSDTAVIADGPVATLPGGKVRLAVGGEYQDHLSTNQQIGTQTTPNNSTEALVFAGRAHRTVKSGFIEGFIPLVGAGNAMPGIQQLMLSLADRFDDYSDFGSTNNPKAGLTWVPTAGLKLRSTMGTSFRAPTLADVDPTQGGTISLQNFVNAASPTGVTRGLLLQGGNNGLGPEKARSWTLGAELKPSLLPGSLFSVDYFNIDYKDRILTPANVGTQALVQAATLAPFIAQNPSAAYVNSLFASPFFKGIAESPSNILVVVDGRKQNTGQARAHGLDLSARYAFSNSLGEWDAGAVGSYFFNFRQSLVSTAPLVSVLNTINNPLRFTARGDLGVARDQFSARVAINYANSYLNNLVSPVARVASYTTADLLLNYNIKPADLRLFGQGARLSLSIQNIFDRQPPYVQNGTFAFDPQIASAIGRFVALGLNTKW